MPTAITQIGADPPATHEHRPAPRVRATPSRLAARWAALLTLTVFAYWGTLEVVYTELAEHTLVGYVPAAIVVLAIAAIGVSLRNDDEPPIYDRDTDMIVGGSLLVLTLAFQGLLNRRFLSAYLVTHVDLLSMVMFFAAGCILLFGVRPTVRYRWVWLLSLSLFPLPYRILVVMLGNSQVAAGFLMLALGVAATAVAAARTRRLALVAGATSAFIGTGLLAAVDQLAPTARVGVYQWVPAVGCAIITGLFMYIENRWEHRTLAPYPHRDLKALTAPRVRSALVLLTGAAVALHLIGAPTVQINAGPTIYELHTRPPLIVPTGWHQLGASPVTTSFVNGFDSARTRQTLEQDTGSWLFDVESRPRRVVVDTVDTALPLTLDIYYPGLVYDISNSRMSPVVDILLPHGVTGHLQTIVDDRRTLTFNRLEFRWNNGPRTQQVTLFSVDNHEADAAFPNLRRRRDAWRIANSMLTVVFRGTSVTEDLHPHFKDRVLLTECASALIATQFATIGRTDG
ncbi:MAG: hypothetical protein QM658_10235 [Gordonia sp. (in: high G+C Gram-positive bacteria)]